MLRRNAARKPRSSSSTAGTAKPRRASHASAGRTNAVTSTGTGRKTSTPVAKASGSEPGRRPELPDGPRLRRKRLRQRLSRTRHAVDATALATPGSSRAGPLLDSRKREFYVRVNDRSADAGNGRRKVR